MRREGARISGALPDKLAKRFVDDGPALRLRFFKSQPCLGFHQSQKVADVAVMVEFFPLGGRQSAVPRSFSKGIKPLAVLSGKVRGEKISGHLGRKIAPIGAENAHENGRFAGVQWKVRAHASVVCADCMPPTLGTGVSRRR